MIHPPRGNVLVAATLGRNTRQYQGPNQRKLIDHAVTEPSAATDTIGDAAKQAGVVVSNGVNERDGGTMYNMQ